MPFLDKQQLQCCCSATAMNMPSAIMHHRQFLGSMR
jgi:hypothetical protein